VGYIKEGEKMTDYDVIVAGAGTGGATTAYTIAKKGHSVLVIDRKARDVIGDKTCGDALGHHHLKELDELVGIPSLPKDIIEYDVNGIDIIAPDREHRLRMAGPTTTGMSFNRHKMGQWFIDLAEKTGAEVWASTRVKKLIFDDGKVSGVTVQREGEDSERKLSAKVVVDATGATGMLRRQMPETSPVEREVAKEDTMVAVRDIYSTPDYTFEEPDILEIYWDQDWTLGGYTWVFPQGSNRVNVGCGLMMIPDYKQPKNVFNDFVKKSWDFMSSKLELIHSGGGIAPVRRPIDTLVDDNFMLVGDAGAQVNPIHGGGIGSSLLGGAHAGTVASEAIESGSTSIDSLWKYNPLYMESYGIKQAALDVFRWFLLNVTNEDINFAMRKGIVKASDLLDTSMTGKVAFGTGEKLKRLMAGIGKVPLLLRVNKIAKLMDEVKEVYSNYPDSPAGLSAWKAKLGPIYEAAKGL
jgi:geranylgeranyl reductase family protein